MAHLCMNQWKVQLVKWMKTVSKQNSVCDLVYNYFHTGLLLSSQLRGYGYPHYPLQRTNHWRLAHVRTKTCIFGSYWFIQSNVFTIR